MRYALGLIMVCFAFCCKGQIAAQYSTSVGSGTPAGWTETNTSNAASYVTMTVSTSQITTPAMDFSSASGCDATYLYFDARTYNGTSGSSANLTIDISTNNGSSYTTYTVFTVPNNVLTTYGGFSIKTAAGANSQVKIRFRSLGANSGSGIGIANIIVDEYCSTTTTIGPYAMSSYGSMSKSPYGAGCDANCNLDYYNLYYQMCNNSTVTSTTVNGAEPEHALWASFDIPSSCSATVTAEYGYPQRILGICPDSRMDGGDKLGIANGAVDTNSIKAGTVVNVGTCNFYSATSTTASTGSSGVVSTGCVGSANADESVTYVAAGPVYVSVYGKTDRSDEIIYYSLTASSVACTNSIVTVVLPVELLSFAAFKETDDIKLKWATETETNNDYFVTEYSYDALNFVPFQTIKAAGNSFEKKEYSCLFTDNTMGRTPYFRIKQVDFNGKYSYSQIILLGTSIGKPSTAARVQLSSFYDTETGKINASFKLESPAEVDFQLFDMKGTELFSQTNISFSEGNQRYFIQPPAEPGMYILVFRAGNNKPLHKKIIITK